MKVVLWQQSLPGLGVRPCVQHDEEEEGIELDEQAVREYEGHRAVYLEALAAFERAMDEARRAKP